MKYTIGLDFGTLSVRGVLSRVDDGKEVFSSEYIYPHGVIEDVLPNGTKLGSEWALQSPNDYVEGMYSVLNELINSKQIDASNIIGIGLAFTSCTFMPILKDGTPLCMVPGLEERPHAWPKLWKHHAAHQEADAINKLAKSRAEPFIDRYGGSISPEWQLPKAWQVLNEDEELYHRADYFIEAGDWMVFNLTGELTKCTSAAGFKGAWNNQDGYPSKKFLMELDPRLKNYVEKKLNYRFVNIGEKVGTITKTVAKKTGLSTKTIVASANIDAHATVPAVSVKDKNIMVSVIGTSTGQLIFADEEIIVPGIAGVVKDGVYPGYFGYETGQNCVGDCFSWFVKNLVPEEYFHEANKKNMDIQQFLTEKAAIKRPGESGLISLDWWNGNRSILGDMTLSGLIIGLNLTTKAEDIYRSLLEATAFGTRKIIENYRENGIAIEGFYASGGIPQKNQFMMQMYADVLDMPVHITSATQGPALGSSIFAAVAASSELGGYDDFVEAVDFMGTKTARTFLPNDKNRNTYDELYNDYLLLHDYFGKGANNVMKRLRRGYIK